MATTAAPRANEQQTIYSNSSILLIGACFVASGATALIYEVLWARMLGLVFGATTFAVSAVLAAFMGGLALGSAVSGRVGARLHRPLRVYGFLEIGIALYALMVPFLFTLVDDVYAAIWTSFRPGFFAFNLWRFVLSFAVLLLPTALMGATLPVLSSALTHSRVYSANAIARLYTCNLVGAILGTIGAGFFMLPLLGIRATIIAAAALNGLIGLAALLVDRKAGSEALPAGNRTEETLLEISNPLDIPADAEQNALQENAGFWLFAAGVSGFVTISTQVAWTRLLTMIIGSSTYAFSLVVALFLLGLSGGAYLMGRTKSGSDLRRVLFKVEIATAFSFLFSLVVANRVPAFLVNNGLRFEIGTWTGLLVLQILAAGMLVLLPALMMGMVMPLVLLWAGTARQRDGSVRLVGRSYAVNTLGAIAGAWSTAFVLIPMLSTRSAVLISASLCFVVACVAYIPKRTDVDRDLRRSLAVGLSAVAVLALFVVAPAMNKLDLSLGAYDTVIRELAHSRFGGGEAEDHERGAGEHRLLMYEEGPTATVSVRKDWDIISMAVNGRTNASDKSDMPTQVMLGQLPLLIAPRIDKGLIVGFGSGVSVGSMLQSGIKSLECVELEPTAIDAGRFFEHVNNRPLNDPRLRLIVDDARTYLRVTPDHYDMIVSEPSHPWVPGVANLFTRDFFEIGRDRLNDDGVFVQWVQIYQLSTDSLRSVLATYKSVFPHVMMFRVGGMSKGKDLILVGSKRPLGFEQLSQRLADDRISAEIGRVHLASAEDVMSWYVCDEKELGPALETAPINTDDNMLIETQVPKEAFKPVMESNGEWIESLGRQARANAGIAAMPK